MGVGDLAVPKRIKKHGGSVWRAGAAYAGAGRGDDAGLRLASPAISTVRGGTR